MTAKRMTTTQTRLKKLARARRDTFLYRQSGLMTNTVTSRTTPKRTLLIAAPQDGMKRTNTLLSVSPTTTLYDIMAVGGRRMTDYYSVCEYTLIRYREEAYFMGTRYVNGFRTVIIRNLCLKQTLDGDHSNVCDKIYLLEIVSRENTNATLWSQRK